MQKKSEIFRCSVKCWEPVFQNLGIFKDRFNDSTMSEASLPEELLRDILSILLSVHEDHFCAWPTFDRPRWKTPPNRHIRR